MIAAILNLYEGALAGLSRPCSFNGRQVAHDIRNHFIGRVGDIGGDLSFFNIANDPGDFWHSLKLFWIRLRCATRDKNRALGCVSFGFAHSLPSLAHGLLCNGTTVNNCCVAKASCFSGRTNLVPFKGIKAAAEILNIEFF